jgi:hypothetical protein
MGLIAFAGIALESFVAGILMPAMSLLTGTSRSGVASFVLAAAVDGRVAAGFGAGFEVVFGGVVAAGFLVADADGFAGAFVPGMLCPACLMESARAAESR